MSGHTLVTASIAASCLAPSGSPRRRRSGSPSLFSTHPLGGLSPTGNWRRRSAVARRSGLGRGLGALIPNEVVGDRSSALLEIPITSIRPTAHQPRTHFDEESLSSLTASINELGVLQPVLVRSVGADQYELIAGERRWRAARRAGLPTIPALVRTASDVAALEQALVENLPR